MNLEHLHQTVGSENGTVSFLGSDAEVAVRALTKLNPDAALLFVDTGGTAWLLYATPDMTVIAAARFECHPVDAPFSLYLESAALKQLKKGTSITVELVAGRSIKISRTPIASAKKKAGNSVTINLPALPGLAPLNAERIAKNINVEESSALPAKAWRDVLNATRTLKIYDFSSDKKVRLNLYVVAQNDTLYVYGADTSHIGGQIIRNKDYPDFRTCITADALDVLSLLFDGATEEQAADVSLSVTRQGFVVCGRDAILFMPAPRIHEAQFSATFRRLLEMEQVFDACDQQSPAYDAELPCVFADSDAFVDGVATGKSLVDDARLGMRTIIQGTGNDNLLELTLTSEGRSVRASVAAEVYANFDFACDLRLMSETVSSLSGTVVFVEKPKYLLLLQEPTQESVYRHVFLVCKQH